MSLPTSGQFAAGLTSFTLLIILHPARTTVLEYIRVPQSNSVTLSCTDDRTGTAIPAARFLLNGSLFFDLANPRRVIQDRPVEGIRPSSDMNGREGITFAINRGAEGSYSCGLESESTSPALQIVGEFSDVAGVGWCVMITN